MSDFPLYIPNLQRAEFCLGLYINNIAPDEVRLIFNTRENMLAMTKQMENTSRKNGDYGIFTFTRVDENDKAVTVRVNQWEHRAGPLKALSDCYPKPEEDKSENIKPTYVASNLRVNIPNVVSSTVLTSTLNGLPATDQVIFQFNTRENMLAYQQQMKSDTNLVFDRCESEAAVGVRLRLEVSNNGTSIFNYLSDHFINLEGLAFNQRNAFKVSTNLAPATSAPAVEKVEENTNSFKQK